MKKKSNGITLVALVITIVILLILAGISISALTNTGIFQKAKEAKQKSENASEKEQSLLYGYEDELSKYTSNDRWDGKVNKPEIMTGMTAIKFTEPTGNTKDTEGKEEKVSDSSKNDWYDYDEKKWANAETEDGSMWVWIPRYAYKVIYNDPNDKSKGGVFDIVFLVGTSDNYYDKDGKLQTAQRQTSKDQTIKTDGDVYTVHPAFTNESSIDYANGGWKKELTGIWVSKFEAGFVDKSTFDADKEKYSSSVYYTQTYVWTSLNKKEDARNYLNRIYGSNATKITYPTFQGEKYSMNYINHSDAFSISRALTEENNVYGLKSSSTDSHLIKNSEWGAVAYLGQSQYGLYNKNIRINNVNMGDNSNFVYAMTGYAAKEEDAANTTNTDAIAWNQTGGELASTTGTIYGIYDMSGGTWERSASLVNNGNSRLNEFGSSLMYSLKDGKSSEYVTVYETDTSVDNTGVSWTDENLLKTNEANYKKNTKYGDAIKETSTAGTENTSWNGDYSYFAGLYGPFFVRGGAYWDRSGAGLFSFSRSDGYSTYTAGFRSVLVAQ